ncbi:MAG: DUF1080 domain-containing protein [Planctomycetota bacterium]
MRLIIALLLFTGLAATAPAAELPAALGQDSHAGWTPDRLPGSFVVDGGVLSITSDPTQKGATLWTDTEYGDLVMELEFKFRAGRVDTGVFLRHKREQIQIGNSGSKKRDMTASPYIAGKGYPVEAEGVADLLNVDGWNQMKIVAVGKRYDVWLNGRHVLGYESPTAIERGPIGLQLHPKTEMVVHFRNLRLAQLQ